MKYIVAAFLFLFSLTATAQERSMEWSDTDKLLAASALVVHTIDWGQSRTVAKNPEQYYERNPLLGDHPSLSRVNNYFIATAILIPVVAHFVPQWRTEILGTWLALEIVVTARNRHLGVRMSF